jgi:hypothetical protein
VACDLNPQQLPPLSNGGSQSPDSGHTNNPPPNADAAANPDASGDVAVPREGDAGDGSAAGSLGDAGDAGDAGEQVEADASPDS